MVVDCCKSNNKTKKCRRKTDNKIFKLPRKFSKTRCITKIKGFSMKSSCAPYNKCKRRNNKTRRTKK